MARLWLGHGYGYGYWLLAIGYWLLAIGEWPQAITMAAKLWLRLNHYHSAAGPAASRARPSARGSFTMDMTIIMAGYNCISMITMYNYHHSAAGPSASQT